jgi:hypothetical protein
MLGLVGAVVAFAPLGVIEASAFPMIAAARSAAITIAAILVIRVLFSRLRGREGARAGGLATPSAE